MFKKIKRKDTQKKVIKRKKTLKYKPTDLD